MRREAAFDPVPTTIAALMESLYVGQSQFHTDLGLVRPLCYQRRGHTLFVQVVVTQVLSQQNTAAKTNRLSRREHSVR